MIRVAALTSGRTVPSARFRVRQHIASLAEHGIAVREHVPCIGKYSSFPGWPPAWRGHGIRPLAATWFAAKLASRIPGLLGSRSADITWLERELVPGRLTLEPLLARPLVWDVDDAIWLTPPRGERVASALAARADAVIAGNRHIAERLGAAARRVEVIPTAIDTRRFFPRDPARPRTADRFVVGWTGLGSNLPYLEAIESALEAFLARCKDAEILVVSDRPPVLRRLPASRVRYEAWSAGTEADSVRGMDAGIMPLPDEPWTRAKCGFKLLQYMACGIPVVASPVGVNGDLLATGACGIAASTLNEWCEALRHLHDQPAEARRMGEEGRRLAVAEYDVVRIAARLASLFVSLS